MQEQAGDTGLGAPTWHNSWGGGDYKYLHTDPHAPCRHHLPHLSLPLLPTPVAPSGHDSQSTGATGDGACKNHFLESWGAMQCCFLPPCQAEPVSPIRSASCLDWAHDVQVSSPPPSNSESQLVLKPQPPPTGGEEGGQARQATGLGSLLL